MKKLLSLLMCAMLLLSVGTTACAEATAFTPGVYEGEGDGLNGKIKVAVTVDENSILSVDVLEHSETAGISDPAFAKLPGEIVAQQTVALDAVAGCTMSSNGILSAVKAALLASGASEESITKAPAAKAAPTETIEKSADVIVIGTGGAGMTAALEVLKAGGSVILIDKMASIGGNTIVAGSAMNAADPDVQSQQEMKPTMLQVIKNLTELEPKDEYMANWQSQIKADIDAYEAAGSTYLYDSPALHKLQTYVDGDYVGNPKLIEIFGDHALESLHFLTDLGAKWNAGTTAAVGATWARSHTPTKDWGTAGASFVLPQKTVVDELGGEILLEYKADELVVENGRVTGVKGATADGATFVLTGNKGVILATGGFAANAEMRVKYNKFWPNAGPEVPTSNPPSSTGDGIVMAEAIGANLVGMEWLQMVTMSASAVSADIENTIQVNTSGERFVKEDGRRDEICSGILSQDGSFCWRILDAHLAVDKLGGVSYKGKNIDEEMVGNGTCFKGETLEELAEQINVPADALAKTIEEYNTYVDGTPDPLGRMVFDQKLDKGPFYALRYEAQFHHTMGGVEINENTEVLNTSGEIIPGLYACGEVTGGIHGSNRLGGNAIADVITFGRIAGQNVMK